MEARNTPNHSSSGNQEIGSQITPADEHVGALLSPFVDGETSVDETRYVEKHLAQCAYCAGQLAFLRATARALRNTSDAFPSPALFERIAHATYQKPTLGERVAAFLRPAPVRVALGGALAAGLVMAFVLPQHNRNDSPHYAANHSGGNGIAGQQSLPSTPKSDAARSAAPKSLAAAVGTPRPSQPSAPKPAPVIKPAAPVVSPLLTAAIQRVSSASLNAAKTAAAQRALVASITKSHMPPPLAVPAKTLAASLPPALLHPARKPVQMAMNSLVVPNLRTDLASRGEASRLPRPEPKVENISAAAVAAPAPVRPEVKPSETLVEATSKVATSAGAASETALAAIAPKRSFRLTGMGRSEQDKHGIVVADFDRSALSVAGSGALPLVSAPVK